MSVGYDVEQFMSKAGQVGPVDDEKNLIASRISLLDEKFADLIEALNWGEPAYIAKEGADMVYLVVGSLVALGIPFDDVWPIVHESNMSRFDEDGNVTLSEDGKVLKGRNYKSPEEQIARLVKS